MTQHGTPSRLLADVGIHVWKCDGRYCGWWGTGVRFADSLAELLYCYVREDNGDPIVHATAVLGRDHGYVMRTEAPDAVTRDVRYSDAWQLAEFVGRCRQRLLTGETQRARIKRDAVRQTGWRDGLLVVPGDTSAVTCGPWPVRVDAAPGQWVGLFFEHGGDGSGSARRLRLANATTGACYRGSAQYGSHVPWVRRCS